MSDGDQRRGPNGERLDARGRQLRACGAVRVSSKKQKRGYSPDTQKQGIVRAAREHGYVIDEADIFEDTARGHVLKRPGYQSIIRGVEEGKYSACFVYMFDRLGRVGLERMARAERWDKLGVPLISAVEGEDEPGVIRWVRVGMAQEESRRISMRVIPGRLAAAQQGIHCGATPYGYQRTFPEQTGGRPPAGLLVPHEPEASVVRWLFEAYASGQWSTRRLAEHLNAQGTRPPQPTDEEGNPLQWRTASVRRTLVNEVYAGWPDDPQKGTIVYGRDRSGFYQQTPEGPEAGGLHRFRGQHRPLVSRALFEQVQHRLSQARCRSVSGQRHARSYLLAGLLRCHACGRPMIVSSDPNKEGDHGQVWCSSRHYGQLARVQQRDKTGQVLLDHDGAPRTITKRRSEEQPCGAAGYRLDLATDALLREVRRLRGAPWSAAGERALAGPNGRTAQDLDREISEARAQLARANQRYFAEITEPTKEDRAAFHSVRAALGARITALEEQLAGMKNDAQALPRLKRLHATLRALSPAKAAQQLSEQGDQVGVRDLLVLLVDHAVLVERHPERRSTWLRFTVVWTADVAALLAAGLLYLSPPEEPPVR